jgi:porphobilinogen deaminase
VNLPLASSYCREKLNDLGYKTKIVAVKSTGDIILDKPLYEWNHRNFQKR